MRYFYKRNNDKLILNQKPKIMTTTVNTISELKKLNHVDNGTLNKVKISEALFTEITGEKAPTLSMLVGSSFEQHPYLLMACVASNGRIMIYQYAPKVCHNNGNNPFIAYAPHSTRPSYHIDLSGL